MKHFVFAFDDAGGVEALCKWDGKPIPGDHPITVLTGLFKDGPAQAGLEDRLNGVRRETRAQLACDTLPPFTCG